MDLDADQARHLAVVYIVVDDLTHNVAVENMDQHVAANDQGTHLATVKEGVQKLSGQRRTEIKYCIQLWIDEILFGVVGKCGGAVLRKTPIKT